MAHKKIVYVANIHRIKKTFCYQFFEILDWNKYYLFISSHLYFHFIQPHSGKKRCFTCDKLEMLKIM